jgi:hypothetical protein
MSSRYELPAAQWCNMTGLRPGKVGNRGHMATDNQTFVHSVIWVQRSGAP